MIWLYLSLAIGALLVWSIDAQRPGHYNLAVLLVVLAFWPLLLVALLFTPKEKVRRWRQ